MYSTYKLDTTLSVVWTVVLSVSILNLLMTQENSAFCRRVDLWQGSSNEGVSGEDVSAKGARWLAIIST